MVHRTHNWETACQSPHIHFFSYLLLVVLIFFSPALGFFSFPHLFFLSLIVRIFLLERPCVYILQLQEIYTHFDRKSVGSVAEFD